MMRTLTMIMAMTFVALNGCADQAVTSKNTVPSDQWTEFGLPSKGDDPGCDQANPLCWTAADARVFREIMSAEDQLILDPLAVESAVVK